MATSLDFATDNGKVRLLISDVDEANPIFPYGTTASPDDAIDAFIGLAVDNNVKRAAALALGRIAFNEVMTLLDVKTDGAKQADALRQLADDYHLQAENEEEGGWFGVAEMVNMNNYGEHLRKRFNAIG